MRESEIQKQIVDALRAGGFLVFRMNAGQARKNIHLCPAGTPDLLAVHKKTGEVYWVEVKTEKGRLSEAQDEMMITLLRAGHFVRIARSVDGVRDLITRENVK